MLNLLRWLLFSSVMYMAEPSLAGGAAPAAPAAGGDGKPAGDGAPSAGDGKPPVAGDGKPPVGDGAPAAPKPEDVKTATEFLSKNVDGFDAKDMKPEQIMAYRSAFDVWTAGEARKYLKSQGVKAEDVAKMSPADAIKAADEARNKPVAYPEFKLPDGMKKDDGLDKSFKDWAGKNKIPPEAAQEIVTAYSTHLSKMLEQSWNDVQKGWRDAVAKDPVIGGDKLATQVLPAIAKMLEEVTGGDSKGLREALDVTGFGNNPEGMRFLHAVSAFFTEGGGQAGNGPTGDGQQKPAATVLYPNQPSEAAAK